MESAVNLDLNLDLNLDFKLSLHRRHNGQDWRDGSSHKEKSRLSQECLFTSKNVYGRQWKSAQYSCMYNDNMKH